MKKIQSLTSLLLVGLGLHLLNASAPAQTADAAAQTNATDNTRSQLEDNATATNKPPVTPEEAFRLRLGLASENTNGTDTSNADSGIDNREGHYHRNPMVRIGHDAELKADEEAEAVVVVGGSASVHGKVYDSVVVIGGDAEIDGPVAQNVVTILGTARLTKNARIGGDLVVVGGKVEREAGAVVKGDIVDTGEVFPRLEWLRSWFKHCFLLMRPLAPQVGWVWMVNGLVFLFYVLTALLFPKPVQVCMDDLTRRPITTLLLGILSHLLVPLIFSILAFTVVGLIAVPFAMAALLLGAVVGKVALLQWVGSRIVGGFAGSGAQRPILALFIGAIVISFLYMIPLLGLLTFAVLGTWGFGAAVSATFGGMRRELPQKPTPVPSPDPSSPPSDPIMAVSATPSNPTEPISPQPTPGPARPNPSLSAPPPALPEILAYPRATFWERMAAAFLDLVLVSILSVVVHGPPLAFLVALAYFAGLWAWRGTTIGGIVLGLKVVRTDGQPVSFLVALVRGLAAAFSFVVLFLGFLWIAWDREKQGWHDRIAGTVVIRMPRGTPLIVL